jgi:hypothetical protein
MDILQIENGKHNCGDSQCCECSHGYPVKCQCGGLIHAEHLGAQAITRDNPFGIKCLCDKCGGRFLRINRKAQGGKSHAVHNSRYHQQNKQYGRDRR